MFTFLFSMSRDKWVSWIWIVQYMDTVFFVQTGDKQDFFYVLTDMVNLGLSSISDAEEAKTIVYYLNLTLLIFISSLSNYWPMTSSWVTGHKCASPVLSYSQHHHQLILFLATCVINSQSRGVADMWCGHVGWKKNRLWAPLMNHVLNLPAL